MTALSLVPSDAIIIHQADIRTTSLKVAEAFGKRHDDVLRKLKSMECSQVFTKRNFTLSEYMDAKGEKRPCYEMTKDGFMFLVMGFTGKQAAQIKEAYINAFNVMAAQLAETGKAIETLTPSEQQTLSEVAHRKAVLHENVGKALAEIWSRLHNKFRIAKYDQLPRAKLAEAIVYVSQLQLKVQAVAETTLTPAQIKAIETCIHKMQDSWMLQGNLAFVHAVTNRIRVAFSVQDIAHIPASDYEKVLNLLEQLKQDVQEFSALIHQARQIFFTEVINNGFPYTADVIRKLGGRHKLPSRPNWQQLSASLLSS